MGKMTGTKYSKYIEKFTYQDDRLIDVVARTKALSKEISDAEWVNSPQSSILKRELNRYKDLLEEGIHYEPKF